MPSRAIGGHRSLLHFRQGDTGARKSLACHRLVAARSDWNKRHLLVHGLCVEDGKQSGECLASK